MHALPASGVFAERFALCEAFASRWCAHGARTAERLRAGRGRAGDLPLAGARGARRRPETRDKRPGETLRQRDIETLAALRAGHWHSLLREVSMSRVSGLMSARWFPLRQQRAKRAARQWGKACGRAGARPSRREGCRRANGGATVASPAQRQRARCALSQ